MSTADLPSGTYRCASCGHAATFTQRTTSPATCTRCRKEQTR